MLKFKALEQDIIAWRRELHKIPELGNELPRTVKYVKQVLGSLGLSYTEYVNGNGLAVVIDSGKAGKCIALRADMDGLPIVEQTGHPFCSTTGNMHACGHDGHTAMLLGAAKYLSSHKDQFVGKIKLMFQPGEEMPGGAKPMIDEGVLKNPKVDAVFGMHNGNLSSTIPAGHVGFKSGPMMAAPDRIVICINGKGAHGAYPEESTDPIVIASELVLALQRLVSREKSATEPAVISICRIEGGFNHNVIPSKVELEGTIRTTTPQLRDYYKKRIQALCDGYAQMHGITIDVNHQYVYPPLINDAAFTKLATATAKRLIGNDRVQILKNPVMGGEDMAFFLEQVPGTYMFMSNPAPIDGICYPHHHPKFDIDESYLVTGTSILCQVAIDYLNDTL